MDLPSLVTLLRLDLVGELVLAAIAGGLIGLEREWRGKPAGLRTNILICIGAALITELSIGVSREAVVGTQADASRLAAQIVSGIGFLGAGTIIQARQSVSGLTSAATLWVVAAIGIAIGSHHLVEAVSAVILVLLVLIPLGHAERWIARGRRTRVLLVELDRKITAESEDVLAITKAAGLVLQSESLQLEGARLFVRAVLDGPQEAWTSAIRELSKRREVVSLQLS